MPYVRDPANPSLGIPPSSPSFVSSGIPNRMQLLFKFLTGCRGARSAAPSDTGKCWPCPTPGPAVSLVQSDWSQYSAGFQTSTYGPLYPIQAGLLASGIFAQDVDARSAPVGNRIESNYANPFNPRTTLRFASERTGRAEIRIFSVSGRLVRVLGVTVASGRNEVVWDARATNGEPLGSGVYFYKILFPDGKALRAPSHLVIVK